MLWHDWICWLEQKRRSEKRELLAKVRHQRKKKNMGIMGRRNGTSMAPVNTVVEEIEGLPHFYTILVYCITGDVLITYRK